MCIRDRINVNAILQNSVLGATVIIDNGTIVDTLDQIPGYGVYTTTQFVGEIGKTYNLTVICLLYTSPSPRDRTRSRMPSSA